MPVMIRFLLSRKEFRTYRDQQIRPYFVSVSAEEKELKRYYDGMKASIGPDGLIHPAHIMILVAQKATPEEQAKAKRTHRFYLYRFAAGG